MKKLCMKNNKIKKYSFKTGQNIRGKSRGMIDARIGRESCNSLGFTYYFNDNNGKSRVVPAHISPLMFGLKINGKIEIKQQ